MKLDSTRLPPISNKFYDRLVSTFPPINPLDINTNTNMIDIQRNAAQQEVIQYIKQSVRIEENSSMSIIDKIKYVLIN